jgi:predicted Zn finger-like uncharacterized protein
MRVVCPSCAAAYEVPEAKLAAGVRRLRCAACGAEWALPPPEEPSSPPPPEPAPAAAAAPPAEPPAEPPPAPAGVTPPLRAPAELLAGPPGEAESPPRPPASGAVVAAWAASVLLLLGCGVAVFYFQAEILRAWPPAARFYGLLGLLPR